MKLTTRLVLIATFCIAPLSQAYEWEFAPFFGQRFSDDIDAADDQGDYSMPDDASFGAVLGWKKDAGLGQILVSHGSYNLKRDGLTVANSDFDVTYAHFGGAALYPQGKATTIVSLGLGATHLSPDASQFSSETYVSAHIGLGARYDIADGFAAEANVRGYGTVTDSNSKILCGNNQCIAEFDGTFFWQVDLTLGLVFKF